MLRTSLRIAPVLLLGALTAPISLRGQQASQSSVQTRVAALVQQLNEALSGSSNASVPTGFYQLEQDIAFNVLDRVAFDPSTGQLSLMGHLDDRYVYQRIPYLQHLATLLESPRPEFSLNWTPDSEARVDQLFKRMDSDEEAKRIAAGWGKTFDDSGRVTTQGRWLLPLLGVTLRSGESYDGLSRIKIAAMILRTSGNHKGASVLEAFDEIQSATESNNKEAAQSVLMTWSMLRMFSTNGMKSILK